MRDFPLSPELRELLGDIADDPRAKLLRVSPRQVLEQAFEQRPRVSSTAAFLGKAERRLLEVHREEMGRLLYSYAHLARMQTPRAKRHIHYHDLNHPAPTRLATDHRAHSLLRSGLNEGSTTELLRRCLAGQDDVQPKEIITALQRVAPSNQARIALCVDLCLDERLLEAEELLGNFTVENPDSHLSSYAWENLGLIAVVTRRFQDAAKRYESAIEVDATRVVPAMDWLWFSVLNASESAALEAAALLDQTVPSDHPAIPWYQRSIDSSLGIVISAESRRLARRVAERTGSTAQRVVSSLAQGSGGVPRLSRWQGHSPTDAKAS